MWKLKIIAYSAFLLIVCLRSDAAIAQVRSIDLMGGSVYNIKSPLLIYQEGRDNMIITADYETRAFEDIPYFVVRLTYKVSNLLFELQYMHHKINLTNVSSDIQHFEITDGFNILSLNYRLATKYLDFRFGFGVALTYCKSTIRGYTYTVNGGIFNSGYFFSGPVLLFGLNREFNLSSHFYLNAETQFSAAWVLFPVAGGYGYVSNLALHLMFGLGYKF